MLLFLSLLQVVFFDFLVLLEKRFDLGIISIQDGGTLSFKFLLNLLKLITVVLSHLFKLLHHALNECLNVQGHLLHGLHIVTILLVELVHELLDQGLFVLDDLGTSLPLNLNILSHTNRMVNVSYISTKICFIYLPQPTLYSLLSLQALASSNRFLHSSYGTE